jgi:hypothetical protein
MCVLRYCFNVIYSTCPVNQRPPSASLNPDRTFNKYKDSTFQKQRLKQVKRPHQTAWPNMYHLISPDQPRPPDLEERPLVAPFVLAVFLGEALAA